MKSIDEISYFGFHSFDFVAPTLFIFPQVLDVKLKAIKQLGHF